MSKRARPSGIDDGRAERERAASHSADGPIEAMTGGSPDLGGGDCGPTVREADSTDAAAIADFIRTAWIEAGADAPGFAGATDEIIDEVTRAESIRARLGTTGRRMFIAVSDAGVVGFAATRRIDDGLTELAGIVVRASESGRGIGKALVRAAADATRRDGADRILVRTERSNSRAIGFYEALGFEFDHYSTEHVDGTAVDVVELSRTS